MPDTVAFVGQTDFKIPIYIENLVGLEGLDISIDYNETVINCEDFYQENTVLENYNVILNDEPHIGHCLSDVCLSIWTGGDFYSGSGNVIFLECSIEGNDQDYSELILSQVEIGSLDLNANHGSVMIFTGGCMDVNACNYNENAVIDDGSCEFESDCAGECDGTAVEDDCGACNGDNTSCTGCMDGTACNYNSIAIISGECEYAVENHDCNGDELSINGLFSPIEFKLLPNFPNPFNPITTINYSIAIFSAVNISIYSINGELIQTLVNSSQQPRQYTVQWNASNFPSGLYLVKLISENKIAEQKVLLIK